MHEMFKQELDGLPMDLQLSLRRRLEWLVRNHVANYKNGLRDPSREGSSDIELLTAIFSIFDLANDLKMARITGEQQ